VMHTSWANQLAVLNWQLEAMQALLQLQAAQGITSASESVPYSEPLVGS
jgi:hypothetical protein